MVDWNPFDGSWHAEPVVRLTLWIVVATASAVVAMLALILVLHARNQWRAARSAKLGARWVGVLLEPEADAHRLRVGPHELEFFLDTWARLVESIRGGYRDELVAKVRRAGVPPLVRELARRGSLRQRIVAIHALGTLEDRESIEILRKIAREADPFPSLQAAISLLEIDAAGSFAVVLPWLVERQDWAMSRVHAAVVEIGTAVASGPVASLLERAMPRVPLRAVRLIGVVEADVRLDLIRRLLHPGLDLPVETEVALVDAIGEPELLDLLRARLEHRDWRVVVSACKALGRIGTEDDVPRLASLLGHEQWWVRYRAARAIAGLPELRPIQVELLAAGQHDPYARDMLRFALAERSLD